MSVLSRFKNPKRPFWVWLISGFYLFSGMMNLSLLMLIHTENPGVSPQELAVLQKTAMAWTLGGLLPLANLAGAVMLFLLRKTAFYIFSAMLIAGVLNGLFQFVRLDWSLETISRQGLSHVLFGYAITLAVCLYTYRLKQQKILS